MLRLAVVLLWSFSANAAEENDYGRYKVYHVEPATETQAELLRFFETKPEFDFWSLARGDGYKADVMVAPDAQEMFESFLKDHKVKHAVKIQNAGSIIETQKKEHPPSIKSTITRLKHDRYLDHYSINSYLKEMQKENPDIVTLELIGKSFEGRELIVLKIGTKSPGPKPAIFIDGGFHGREWITPATVLYIIDQLIHNKDNSYLYKDVDWYFLPVLNPDGYHFSFTTLRLWRKTRSLGNLCNGADPNRNFDYYWGTVGSTTIACLPVYSGPHPFSEVETASMSNFTKKHAEDIKLYLSFHSYGQYVLFPWSYANIAADNDGEMRSLGKRAAQAIFLANGTRYTVGSSYSTLYPASGTSVDWMKGALNVPLSYTIELPDRGYGFLLPVEYIYEVSVETFAGVKVFADYVIKKYVRNG